LCEDNIEDIIIVAETLLALDDLWADMVAYVVSTVSGGITLSMALEKISM